jgi:hypothetical protein
MRSVAISVPSRTTNPAGGSSRKASCRVGGALGEEVDRLVHVPTGGGGGDAEPRSVLGQGLVLAQVHQDQQSLPETAQSAPARVQLTPSGVDEPGNVLNDFVRDVEHGSIRDQQGSCVETLASEINSRNDQETCRVTALDHQPSSPANHTMRSVQRGTWSGMLVVRNTSDDSLCPCPPGVITVRSSSVRCSRAGAHCSDGAGE